MTRPLSGLGLDDEDLAAWRRASGLTIAAIEGVTLTADALLLLGAQCVASAAHAIGDLALAMERTSEMAWTMRQHLDGPPPDPVRILAVEDTHDP